MTIFEKQLLEGKIYCMTEKRKRRLNFALEGIERMFETSPQSYLSLSWGKQSICLADMLYKLKKEIPMYFLASEETWNMYNFVEVIHNFREKHPAMNYHCIQTHRFDNYDTWKSGRDAGDRDLQNMCDRNEWTGWFWGLAKDESKNRRITLSINNANHPTIFQYTDGKYRCCPIMNWNLQDIAAYLYENDIDILNVYKKFGLQMRTTARITKKARDAGAMFYINIINKKGFNNLEEKHEEVTF